MLVQSNERPLDSTVARGMKVVNVGVREVTRVVDGVESMVYEYHQFEFDSSWENASIEIQVAKQVVDMQLMEARELLDSTQFKFGDDYDQKGTPEWLELKAKRQEAREFIRANQ